MRKNVRANPGGFFIGAGCYGGKKKPLKNQYKVLIITFWVYRQKITFMVKKD
jgi:hypothetical protein